MGGTFLFSMGLKLPKTSFGLQGNLFMKPRETLLKAFSCWTDEEQGNMKWHLKEETTILFGTCADDYVQPGGA